MKRSPSAHAALVLAISLVALVGLLAGVVLSASAAPASAASDARDSASPATSATAAAAEPASGGPTLGPLHQSPAQPASSVWTSDFFSDIQVTFAGTGLSGPFELVPYTNDLPTSDLGFWLNVSSLDPLSFANVTIWGTEWANSTTGVANPITGFAPNAPNVAAMQVDPNDPNLASYYFDNYRFFWPGSTVYFNITAVDLNANPTTVKSSTNDSIPVTYTGGYTDLATWAFSVDTPWASSNFTDDIAITTTPNVVGTPAYAPNADQTLGVTITAIDLGGTVVPIPSADVLFAITENGVTTAASENFGPIDHTVMSIPTPLGPYPGATVAFTVDAWLPWEGGAVDTISSPTYKFTWSPNGGWWYPTQGLLGNLQLAASPDVLSGGVLDNSATSVPTDAPVNVTIHEPIQNVTIASAAVDFSFDDNGLVHTGSVPMRASALNTSYAVLPGLPPGSSVTFSILAKDIHGDPISSGNFTYLENGPTNPSLPAGHGLLFLEVLDLTDGALAPGFTYAIANATWSTNGTASPLGFASPTVPSTDLGEQLGFGAYSVAVTVFGVTHVAQVTLSASSPTPTIVFYAESSAAPIPTTASGEVASLAAALGLAGAAVVALPLTVWLEERRQRHAEEERRITL